VVVYSHFVSSLKQTPVVKQILPLQKEHIDLPELWVQSEEKNENIEYKIEPNPEEILNRLLYRFMRLQVYGAVLEGNASEHSARMVAMKNATDNAGSLIDDLTLTYNTIRQNSITSEIAEISGAAEAMK
jgi:F-type H+-transporting ATPase subunit gamma